MKHPSQFAFQWPKPSKLVLGMLALIGGVWLLFALGMNWGGSGNALFELLIGDSRGVFRGEVWRLFSAPWLHNPRSPMHPLMVGLMLYFFAPPLEERWGPKRLLLFLIGTAAGAFCVESLMHLLVPSVAQARWYGGMLMVDALAVAWAFSYRHQTVQLFFVLPMKPLMMVGLMVGWHVLALVVRSGSSEGLVAPFAAMLLGWLFCDSGPGRRAYLRFKLQRVEKEIAHLRVVRGGKDSGNKP